MLCFSGILTIAQPALPQRTMTVEATQAINFGKFCVTGNGGTISVSDHGSVSTTGGIVFVFGSNTHPAIFNVKLCPGRNVGISFGGTTYLTDGGAGLLALTIDSTDPNLSLATSTDCNFINQVRVGATLSIPGGAPVGIYTGHFNITFTQE